MELCLKCGVVGLLEQLQNNQLCHIPLGVCALFELTVLTYGDNRLTAVPSEICQLKKLHTLSVRRNRCVDFVFRTLLLYVFAFLARLDRMAHLNSQRLLSSPWVYAHSGGVRASCKSRSPSYVTLRRLRGSCAVFTPITPECNYNHCQKSELNCANPQFFWEI